MSIELTSITSGYNLSAINTNFETIETYINGSLLARKGNVAGETLMERDLDMNGFAILNADVDVSSLTNDRAIRVPASEPSLDPLPVADLRKGKVLSFDINTGLPVVIAPSSGSAVDVLNQLALPTGASLVGYGTGTVKTALDSFSSKDAFNNLGRFLNITELRAFPPTSLGQIVFVASAASTTQGERHYGGGYFEAINKGSIIDDGGMNVVPATGTLSWARIQAEKVYIEHFGAKGDGVYDSTDAILRAMDYGKRNQTTIFAGPGVFETSSTIPVWDRSGLVGVGRDQTIFEKTTNNPYTIAPGVTADAFMCILAKTYAPDGTSADDYAILVNLDGFTLRRKGLTGRENAVQYGIWAMKLAASRLNNIRVECGYFGFWGEDVFSNTFENLQFLGLGVGQFCGFQISRFRSGVYTLSGTSNVMSLIGIAGYQFGFKLDAMQYSTMNSCTADAIRPMSGTSETLASAYRFINPHGITMNGCGSEGVSGERLSIFLDGFAVYDATVTVNSYQGQIVQENPVIPNIPIIRVDGTGASKFCSVSLINCNLKKDSGLTNQAVGFIVGPTTKVYNVGSIIDIPNLGGGATFTSL